MAANEMVWNIEVQGVPYKIELKKNRVSVNGREPVKLAKLKRSGSTWETNYSIPIEGEEEAVLHIRQFSAPILTYKDIDCSTGEQFVPLKVPAWVWIFVVLHAIDFFLMIGGAIGGALQAFVICLMVSVSAKKEKSLASRVFTCLGIWLLSTIVQLVFVLWIYSL